MRFETGEQYFAELYAENYCLLVERGKSLACW